MADTKNWVFQNHQFSIFFVKISGIGPWVRRIKWCKGHWYGSIYMVVRLSNTRSKAGKKCIFCVFCMFRQPGNHIGWTTSMHFTSIYPTDPRTNLWNFNKTISRIGGFEKLVFFWVDHFDFLFQNENQSQIWDSIFMNIMVFSQKWTTPNIIIGSVHYIQKTRREKLTVKKV